MKLLFVPALLGLTLFARVGLSATSAFYVNDGIVNVAPVIDATNFVNNGTFDIVTSLPFDTSNTRNFTNRNLMIGSPGYRFDNAPTGPGLRKMAANFCNSGTITTGSNTNFFTNIIFFSSNSRLLVSATNIVNSGTLNIGTDGLLSLAGKNVDLTRASLRAESFEESFFNVGIFDRYWGAGTTNFDLAGNFFSLPFPRSPIHSVIEFFNGFYFTNNFNSIFLNGASGHAFVDQPNATNVAISVVLLSSPSPGIVSDVRFGGGSAFRIPVVEWRSSGTNALTGAPFTNLLYLSDFFGAVTNMNLVTNDFVLGVPTLRPFTYDISRSFFGFNFLPSGNTAYNPSLFAGDNSVVTNDFMAYSVDLTVTSAMLDATPGASVTNLPGRIEITADSQLNLSRARIEGQNYVSIRATNHFIGSTNLIMAAPFCDFNLAATNGHVAFRNILAPIVPRLNGNISMWSGRWTNNITVGTNVTQVRVHVLLVDDQLEPTAPSLVQDFITHSTNVVVGDVLNVFRTFLVDAERLTITSNGVINILSPDIIWATALPRLQSLTNEGSITIQNAVFFGGDRREPHFNPSFQEPYQYFVNYGSISTAGTLIWANYFENGGSISSTVGPITLQSGTGIMTNGVFSALSGDISLNSDTLLVTNHIIQSARRLFLAVTNELTDGGTNSANAWQVGEGFELTLKPASGDLLGTTLTSSARANADVVSVWAGEDRGFTAAGYSNNAALGKLILDGDTDSVFTFAANGASNALYVDFLELRNNATNFNAALAINPNMKVYFANANLPAEKIATHPSGRLCWASDYTGLYSSTNLVYPSGQTNTFNIALVQSCNLDSDDDGTVNCADPTPISTPESVVLSVVLASGPPLTALVSWDGLANSTNFLFAKSNLIQPSWRLLTNFVHGPENGRITVADPANPFGPCFYRVRVDARHP